MSASRCRLSRSRGGEKKGLSSHEFEESLDAASELFKMDARDDINLFGEEFDHEGIFKTGIGKENSLISKGCAIGKEFLTKKLNERFNAIAGKDEGVFHKLAYLSRIVYLRCCFFGLVRMK